MNWQKLISILLWVPLLVLKLWLTVIGWFVVPIALGIQHMTFAPSDQKKHWPDVFWLWGNDEEGCPDWWLESKLPWYVKPWPRFWWFAVRNPVNNFRFIVKDVRANDCEVQTNWNMKRPMEAPALLDEGQGSAYHFAQHKWKSGYRRVWLNGQNKYSELWIGWKLGSPVPGLGFTFQLRLRREIGT